MKEAKIYADTLKVAIQGITDDAAELMRAAKIELSDIQSSIGIEHQEVNGLITMQASTAINIKIGAAMGAANQASDKLDDGDLLFSAMMALLGQKCISSAAGKLLGVQLGKDRKFDNPAAALAKMRHAENYALVDDALKYWRENIDPSLSASMAANELMRVVPLSHKKLAEVIAAEKKKSI